jgi:hypothetical protein
MRLGEIHIIRTAGTPSVHAVNGHKKSRRFRGGFRTSISNDQATAIRPLSLLMAFDST